MSNPWMLVIGSALAGWLFVESFSAFGSEKIRVPIGLNVIGAVAGALIAGSFVL
jgi:hypothetical protein